MPLTCRIMHFYVTVVSLISKVLKSLLFPGTTIYSKSFVQSKHGLDLLLSCFNRLILEVRMVMRIPSMYWLNLLQLHVTLFTLQTGITLYTAQQKFSMGR